MKNCNFCYKDDLNDNATRCPHCGSWLSLKMRIFMSVGHIIAWIFLIAFIIFIPTCAILGLKM